jgi:hypothetical protein
MIIRISELHTLNKEYWMVVYTDLDPCQSLSIYFLQSNFNLLKGKKIRSEHYKTVTLSNYAEAHEREQQRALEAFPNAAESKEAESSNAAEANASR